MRCMRRDGPGVGRWHGALLLGMLVALVYAMAVPATSAQRPGDQTARRVEPMAVARKPNGPLQIIISIDRQTLRLFDQDGLVEQATVSTGTGGFPTPTGIFSIIDKEKDHFSNIYRGASMPYMQRLTMSGVALHSGIVTGRPASHGCVRLPHAYAIHLFRLTRLGARVIIANVELSPASIEHPRLFKPQRPQLATASGASVKLASLPKQEQDRLALAAALASELQREVARAKIGEATAEREAALKATAVSVFISRATQRVYVRHGFLPLLDAPVAIRDADHPIGTHVYTAVQTAGDGTHMRWTAVSYPQKAGASDAGRALDRIELPAEITERISGMLTPGATLIVSDQGPSRQMRAWGTDFIILAN
ncbi:MAG TPA: L,D-transpeptidase [Hyphomicrobiaceae bacterium]|nr:L,D-transpeptidase [Hyphomicrobiaceae bacterium]